MLLYSTGKEELYSQNYLFLLHSYKACDSQKWSIATVSDNNSRQHNDT